MERENIIGIDEAGRGPLAGPIVAAAIFSGGSDKELKLLDLATDSKKISPEKREGLYNILINNFIYGVVVLDNNFIDRYGIQTANIMAVHNAWENVLQKINCQAEVSLADYVGGHRRYFSDDSIQFFTKGELRYKEIAAASIIAKVYRDKLMKQFHFEYPEYNFFQHKGYGTREHLRAIKKFGPSKIHRLSFIK